MRWRNSTRKWRENASFGDTKDKQLRKLGFCDEFDLAWCIVSSFCKLCLLVGELVFMARMKQTTRCVAGYTLVDEDNK